jgi:uncharacterized protein (TIGR03000 family)
MLCVSGVTASGRRTNIPPVYNAYPWGYVYPQFNPYIAPAPAYGVMPIPYYGVGPQQGWGGGPLPYRGFEPNFRQAVPGPTTNDIDYIPRARPSLYPAVPYEPTPTKGAADKQRARFEFTVPVPNAVVLFDGVKTTQTGLNRVFNTPTLAEGKQYTMAVEVQFRDEAGTPVTLRRTFEFTAGETITHRFAE